MKKRKTRNAGKEKQANLHAALRGVVALYLISIAVRLVKSAQESVASMPIWATWLIAAVFAFTGILFGLYAWRVYRWELETADASHEEDSPDESPNAPTGSQSVRPL